MYKFEWDQQKNEANIHKHGIDFQDAKEAFLGPFWATLDNRHDYGEERLIGLGMIKGIVVVIIFVEKENQTIRIISVRKAEKDEYQTYYEKTFSNELGET